MNQANMKMKRSSAGNGSFACSFCSHTCNTRSHLKAHTKTIHNKLIGVLECCDICFSDKASLRHHTVAYHQPKYQCAVCDRRYYTPTILRRHQLIHSDYKEFKCNLCGYATSLKGNLKQHMERRNHRGGPDEEWSDATEPNQKYQCKICRRDYRSPSKLRQHIMTVHDENKKFKCSMCDYVTTRKGHQKRHFLRIHKSKGESTSINVSVRRSRMSNLSDACDSPLEENAVKALSGNRRLRSLRSTFMDTENGESPIVEKRSLSNKIEEPEAPFDTRINNVVDRELCSPSRQMIARHLEIVDDVNIRNDVTSPTSYVDGASLQQVSPYQSLPVLLDSIHEEARQLRSQISLATTIPAVLSLLERLLELSASLTNQIRGFVEDEPRSQAIECFEYVWSTSKTAVGRWTEMGGSNTYLRAVQYAYETLPVFFSLEINEHLEMMEHIMLLIINTVKNCNRSGAQGLTITSK